MRLALFWCVVKLVTLLVLVIRRQEMFMTYCVTFQKIVVKASKAKLAQIVDLWIQRLEDVLLLFRQISSSHRQCEIRSSLVNV